MGLGERLLDYADVAALRPINHRVLIETIAGETIEISMLGFAYDGFWDELTRRAIQNTCALELFTGEDTATYLYRFTEPAEQFLLNLREATEAMGIHREIIFLPEEKIAANPLYCMAVVRSQAVRFLRARSCGRLIHGASHAQRLEEYLNK